MLDLRTAQQLKNIANFHGNTPANLTIFLERNRSILSALIKIAAEDGRIMPKCCFFVAEVGKAKPKSEISVSDLGFMRVCGEEGRCLSKRISYSVSAKADV